MTELFKTMNPVGSTDPRDLYDNSFHLDEFTNSTALRAVNRFGVYSYTLAGLTAAAVEVAGLRAQLLAPDGATRVNTTQMGAGASTRSLQDEARAKVYPEQFLAVGDGVTNDTSRFTALEGAFKNRIVDLQGKTYLVDSRPIGNRYTNGFFKVGSRSLSADLDGAYSEKKFPFDFVSSQWKKKAIQSRLPPRTREYRLGLYRDASAEAGVVYFSRVIHDVTLETNAVAGGNQQVTPINIKRGQATASRLSHIVRIGPSPTTAFQDFAQVKGTDTLFIASGHEVVPGSGVDALVVELGTRGSSTITTTSYQNPLAACSGHAGFSLQYYDDNSYRMWSGGSAAGTAARFTYGGTPTGGDATNVEVFQFFDENYNSGAYVAVSHDQRWLVAVGRVNTSTQIVRVWRMEDLAAGGDYRQSYVYEWAIPYELLGDNFPMQGLASDGGAVFILTGGFMPGTPGSIKLGQFTMSGETIQIIRDVTVGAGDYATYGTAWEPEGLEIYQAGPNSYPQLAMGIVTGSGGTKHHTIWILGGSGPTLVNDGTVSVKKSGNLPGFLYFRDNSPSNAFNAVQTQTGTIY